MGGIVASTAQAPLVTDHKPSSHQHHQGQTEPGDGVHQVAVAKANYCQPFPRPRASGRGTGFKIVIQGLIRQAGIQEKRRRTFELLRSGNRGNVA
jgi:hypothetical protein